jgi:hypothetical protein
VESGITYAAAYLADPEKKMVAALSASASATLPVLQSSDVGRGSVTSATKSGPVKYNKIYRMVVEIE